MNALERVNNIFSGQPIDRVPNLNIIMQFAAKYTNTPYGVYCTDHRYLVEANIKCCQDFGIDMVSAISDPFRETAGFGGNVIINVDDTPICKSNLIANYADLKKIRPIEPSKSARMADRVNAIALYKKECSHEYPILGWVEGPFAEANDLRGINNLMLDLYDEPDFVNELIEICYQQALLFAKAQIQEGAQFIGIGDSVASLVSPEIFKNFVMPAEAKLISEIHKLGAKAKLHICGNTNALLPDMIHTGADIVDIDHMVDLAKAVNLVGKSQFICGNFDPVSILLFGTEQEVQSAVRSCLDIGKDKIILSAGCEVPKFTPTVNMKAIAETLSSYGG